jgi:hypothetical protein
VIDDPESPPKKSTRARAVRFVVGALLVIAAAMAWIYPRYLITKAPLGGPCTWAMHCTANAPRCLKESEEGAGVCSRACKVDGDCAAAPSASGAVLQPIRCVKVELEERDERGVPIEGGYCVPQAVIDARKRPPKEPRAPRDSWIDVPEAAGQFEGEIAFSSMTYLVKGTLLRPILPNAKARRIIDTATMRAYTVDDDRKSFAASALSVDQAEARITKTGKRDRVADRDCEVWQIAGERATREACVLQGAAFVDASLVAVPAWQRELAVRTAFPLRIVENGATTSVAQTVNVHPVDAASFAIPKAYKNSAGR